MQYDLKQTNIKTKQKTKTIPLNSQADDYNTAKLILLD